ncbi:MAG: ATP synthase F1 subunit delta [Acidobacteria bacterium]|nr:ATP synthase F1 subunit delta [Acidobacteriota bacterium]
MSSRQVARRYAQALCDIVATQADQQVALEELGLCRELFEENADLRETFASPAIPRAQKERLLQALVERLQPTRTTANLLRVLLLNERLGNLPEIAEEFAKDLDRRQGVALVEIRTARPLTEEQQRSLGRRFEELTGQKVRMSYVEDDGLIGGVVAKWGSEVFDGSVRAQLETLRQQLTR